MPRRLATLLFLAALAGGALTAGAHGDYPGAPGLAPFLESPARFVPPPPPTLAQRAVALARSELGVPYVYGGMSPEGFDCSGLVAWVYGRLGLALPHNAAALFGVGHPVRASAMKPGDLVFFEGLGHVGIYVGRGQMIHAPHTGEQVEIESLGERSGTVVGARRMVLAS